MEITPSAETEMTDETSVVQLKTCERNG